VANAANNRSTTHSARRVLIDLIALLFSSSLLFSPLLGNVFGRYSFAHLSSPYHWPRASFAIRRSQRYRRP